MHLARLASAIVIICLHGGNRCFQPVDMLKFAKHSVCFDAFVRHMASVAREESPTTFQEAKIVLHITKARFHAFPLSLMVNPRRFCTGFHVSRQQATNLNNGDDGSCSETPERFKTKHMQEEVGLLRKKNSTVAPRSCGSRESPAGACQLARTER